MALSVLRRFCILAFFMAASYVSVESNPISVASAMLLSIHEWCERHNPSPFALSRRRSGRRFLVAMWCGSVAG